MNARLEKRAKELRARAAVRAWEYRQRDAAKGVWFRLRRVLTDAAEAYVIPDSEADRLVAEGNAPEPVGSELEPSKRIFFVSRARLGTIAGARAIAVRLDANLLLARNIVLARWA